MFCAISGNVPDQPVVSNKSGHLFEKKLVEKYVRETGKCPITGEPLALEDLLPVKANKAVKPRTAPATSVPGLLGIFHDEWDALMLETHTLRQGLHSTRQELSHALYQHDAACRVIARLIKERDDARTALEDAKSVVMAEQAAKQQRAAAEEAAAAEPPGKKARVAGIPEPILQELMEFNAQLSKGRKKRALPPTLATPDDFAGFSLASSNPLHKTTQVFDYAANKQLASLEGHAKRLTGRAATQEACAEGNKGALQV
ncbi:pre-mRNA-processing factor 19-like protein [Dunaliella salina]|uniref:Pre-mRNA-processing factor 19 n=1 Tax=Dunaliella salina TaxID=3046 RepID=A0ABQ7H2H1_DUNSA|nr:pre-mRNA-processing factor 19-like protein [Dunaliella salina]|eukprot:KAF5841040.1 pre-mRNA-processing factor 19-like protein [Dunaliella salina]